MRDYVQQLTVEQFGAMVATATRTVGSAAGPYLGYTPTGAPLPGALRPDAGAEGGPRLGGASDRHARVGEDRRGAGDRVRRRAPRVSLVVDFDPKPDHGLHKLPELDGRLQVLELSGDPAQQGRLDPLAIGLEDMREELACSYLLELLPGPPRTVGERGQPRGQGHGTRGLTAASCASSSCSAKASVPAAREAGEALEVIRDFGLASAWGSVTGPATINHADTPVTTIRMPGLSLPEPCGLTGHLHPRRARLRRDTASGRGLRAAAHLR